MPITFGRVIASSPVHRAATVLTLVFGAACATQTPPSQMPVGTPTGAGPASDDFSPQTLAAGRQVFRFETFGDEQFWTDTARMHEVVQKSVSPTTALSVGLKVDADAIPADVAAAIKAGKVDLNDPATTVTLLKLNVVVGLKGTVTTVNGRDNLTRLGITCALCHSTVDNSFSKGIGHRKDGWPNRELNVGAIIALSPAITAAQKAVYNSWGPGKYDPRFNIDGKSTPLVLPPAYGLARVRNETYTAEGPISYWNAYVAVTQMHGHGNFSDPRLGINIRQTPDMVGPKLASLRAYQHSIEAPAPPAGMGAGVRTGDELPAVLHGDHPPQAGAKPLPASLLPDGARCRRPVRARRQRLRRRWWQPAPRAGAVRRQGRSAVRVVVCRPSAHSCGT